MAINIESLTDDLFRKYDHNGNGTIELNRPDTVWKRLMNPDERVRRKTGVSDIPTSTGTEVSVTLSDYSANDLFVAADANRDKIVTRDELKAAIAKFDVNGDGYLKRRSLLKFMHLKRSDQVDRENKTFKDAFGSNGEKLISQLSTQFPIE